jgi:hypothetical protein
MYAIIYESVYAKGKPSLYKSRVAEKSVKGALNLQDLQCLTIFIYIIYLYNNSSAIQTIKAEIYLFTMGTPYKINSRTLVFASSGEGFFPLNIPPRRHSAFPSPYTPKNTLWETPFTWSC